MDEVRHFVESDRLAKYLGIEVFEHADGKAMGRMVIQAHHLNSAGTLHGGAIFTLADVVLPRLPTRMVRSPWRSM
jgi:acyl-CoA thioesterase